MMCHTRVSTSLIAAVVLLGFCARSPGQNVVQWEFDDESLFSDDDTFELLPEYAPPAPFAEFFFDEVDIDGEAAEVVSFSHGTYFRALYNFQGNGGGDFVNQYTLIMDVMYPDRSPAAGWGCLYNTNDGNPPGNDGDWFVNPAGGIGISGNYGGMVEDGVWYRLALVVDLVAGTYTSYIDGVQVQQNTGEALDGRFSLYVDRLLLFGDNDGDSAPGIVNSVQLRDEALSASQVAALGGPCAAGIGKCSSFDCFEQNFAVAYDPATASVACSWNNIAGDDGYRVLRDGVQLGGDLGGGETSLTDASPPPGASPTYTLQVLRNNAVAGECSVTVATFSCPANLVCCPDQTDSSVELTWDAGTNLAFSGYEVLRDGVAIASPGAAAVSFTDTEVPGPGVYRYELALAGAGDACSSLPSCIVSVTGIEIRSSDGCGGVVNQYDFNGDLTSSTGGVELIPQISPPLLDGDFPDFEFLNMDIDGEEADVMRYGRGTVFKLLAGLPPNGGGQYVNRYTLLMDVMFPASALDETGWAPFYNTNATNSNDGDWFLRGSDRGIGISGNYGGFIEDETWYRIALVVDLVAGTYTSYIDGVQVQQNTGQGLDGRFSLFGVDDPDDGFHIFADESGENAAGFVNSLQVRDVAMSAGELATFGGPTAGGIPFTTPYLCPTEVNCCSDQDARTVTISWNNAAGLPGMRILRDGELVGMTGAEVDTFTDTDVPVGSHEYTFTVDGPIDCANLALRCNVSILGEHFFFDDFNCHDDDGALAAAGWQAEDVGEPLEASTWTVGNPLGRTNPPGPDGRATSGGFVISDSDFGGSDTANVVGSGMSHDLVSPSFSTSGSDTVWLHMDVVAQLNNNGDAVFDVDVSTDGGASWNNVFRRVSPGRCQSIEAPCDFQPLPSLEEDNADGLFGPLHVDLSAVAADSADVRVRLRHFEPTWDWFVAVDNFLVDARAPGGDADALAAEDFADGIPEDWRIVSGPAGDGFGPWETVDNCQLSLFNSAGMFPDLAEGRQLHHFEDAFALADPFCDFSLQDEYLITPALDLSSAGSVFLHVSAAVLPTNAAIAEILVSFDDGETFEASPVFSYNAGGLQLAGEEPYFNNFVFEVPSAAGRSEVAFAFHYRSLGDVANPGAWWAVSNVRVTTTGGGGSRFVRGDSDQNQNINLTDGVHILRFLFVAGAAVPGCLDASDADDMNPNNPNLTDGVFVFLYLFAMGAAPPAPTPSMAAGFTAADCGADPTPDDGIGCASPPDYCN